MVDNPLQLQAEWFIGIKRVGLTAGASAPEALAQSIIEKIKEFGPRTVRPLDGVIENTIFQLPKGLNANTASRIK
jgi:4-hydroxy-3-methylbut-2-enyl diphosphate reductase